MIESKQPRTIASATSRAYLFDKVYAGFNLLGYVALPVLLTLGLNFVSNSTVTVDSPTSSLSFGLGYNINYLYSAWMVLVFSILWIGIWSGNRWAFVINLVLSAYFAVDCLINKTRTPFMEIGTIVYLSLRLSDSLGPALRRNTKTDYPM